MIPSFQVEGVCPSCGQRGTLWISTIEIDLPYFGRSMESALRCEGCSWRRAYFLPLEEKEPRRVTFTLEDPKDLSVRVFRSPWGVLRIPEIGFVQEPSEASEAYVTNVEGVLDRVLEVLRTARSWMAGNPDKERRANEAIQAVEGALLGTRRITIVLEDPTGCSGIVSSKAQEERIEPS